MTRDDFAEGEIVALREGRRSRPYAAPAGSRARVYRTRAYSTDSLQVRWQPRAGHNQQDGSYPVCDFISLCPRKG